MACLNLSQAVVQFSSSEDEEEKLKATLELLKDMKIRFPGKSDEEAQDILEKVEPLTRPLR